MSENQDIHEENANLQEENIQNPETESNENVTAAPSLTTNIAVPRTLGVTQQNLIARRDSSSSEQAAPEPPPAPTVWMSTAGMAR